MENVLADLPPRGWLAPRLASKDRSRSLPPTRYTAAFEDIALNSEGGIYYPSDVSGRANGIDELRPPDPYSKYGCSKGTADQYIIDHARTFGLLAVRFRMKCICGHQMGNEDQGWVAHSLIRALEGYD